MDSGAAYSIQDSGLIVKPEVTDRPPAAVSAHLLGQVEALGSRTRQQKLSHATLWLGTSTLSRMSTPGRRLQNAHPRGEITSVPLSPLACVYTCNHMFLRNVLFLHFLKEIQTARYPASSSPCVPVIAQAHTSHAEDGKPRKADAAVGALGSRGLQNRPGVWRGRGGQVGRRGPPCPSTPTAQI